MHPHNRTILRFRHGAAAAVLLTAGAAMGTAHAIDWGQVEGKEIRLIYAGQASFERAMTPARHDERAVQRFREEGRNCKYCHDDEQDEMGENILSGDSPLEPNVERVAGMPPFIDLQVQAAHDGENAYFRLSWDDASYDGEVMDPDYQARANLMFSSAAVRVATRAGCWGTCHDDMLEMAYEYDGEELTKYLFESRTQLTPHGAGTSYRSGGEIKDLISKGVFMEYWQAKLTPEGKAVPVDGYVLDKRHIHDQPAVSAEAEYDGTRWSVVFSRPLAADRETRKDLEPGTVYHGGFAIHEANAHRRFHHVSLEYTFTIDSDEGDIAVMRQ